VNNAHGGHGGHGEHDGGEMHDDARELVDGIDPQRLCDAATAVYFAIARMQARAEGRLPQIPLLLSPRALPPCPCTFSRKEVIAAEEFLRRLGMIWPKDGSGVVLR
jgi:hypothetical protein